MGDSVPAHQRQSVLALYNTTAKTKISTNASAYRLGVVLLQQHGDYWKMVAFGSTSMTATEWHYSQIKKEALALVWARESFPRLCFSKAH